MKQLSKLVCGRSNDREGHHLHAGKEGGFNAGNAGKLVMPLVPTRDSIRSSAIMPALLSLSKNHHNNAGDYEAIFKADNRPEQ